MSTVEQVFVFDNEAGHWGAVPVRPLREFEAFLDTLRDPGSVRGYWLHHLNDDRRDWPISVTHRTEMDWMMRQLHRRFRVDFDKSTYSPFRARELKRFTLVVRPEPRWSLKDIAPATDPHRPR